MRAHGYGYTVFLGAMICTSQCFAQTARKEPKLNTERTSVRQQPWLASPRIGPISSVFGSEKHCTYRGGPKTGFWSCQ